MGTVELYRMTGEKKYLRLAVKFLDLRDLATDGTDDNQDRIPFRKQTEAVGHAVRANYLYAGAADVFAETGDETLLDPLKTIWANVVSPEDVRHRGVRGAVRRRFARRLEGPEADRPRRTRPTAATTSCRTAPPTTRPAPRSATSCGTGGCSRSPARRSTPTCWKSALYNARPRRRQPGRQAVLLHEHAAPARHDAGAAALVAQPRGVDQLLLLPAERRPHHRRRRAPTPTAARTAACGSTCTAASTLDTTLPDGRRVKLKQETDYPWDGRVKITIESAPAGEVSLFVRVPGWADGATLARERQAGGRRLPAATPRCGGPGRPATSSNSRCR